MMKNHQTWKSLWPLALLLAASLAVLGCNSGKDKAAVDGTAVKDQGAVSAQAVPVPAAPVNAAPAASAGDVAVDVDGEKMTTAELRKALDQGMASLRSQVPPEKLAEVEAGMRKDIVEQFITRAVFVKETERRKVQVPEQEVEKALTQLQGDLPKGMTFEQAMKAEGTTLEKVKSEIRTRLGIRKMILEGKDTQPVKPAEKEVEDFYKKNPEQFKLPERVHARHILIALAPGDDEKAKAAKAAKAKDVRAQLAAGANFAELAKKYSDCPSKEAGGDLGEFARGQMIKPFEDAAFTQKKDEIGPVVETTFGYHIIQVLGRQAAGMAPLNAELKEKISGHLASLNQRKAVEQLAKDLRAKAKIVYGKPEQGK
jgi:peptidyl-prolyl cis-trans isomerase C